jgi:hypothetical protein
LLLVVVLLPAGPVGLVLKPLEVLSRAGLLLLLLLLLAAQGGDCGLLLLPWWITCKPAAHNARYAEHTDPMVLSRIQHCIMNDGEDVR